MWKTENFRYGGCFYIFLFFDGICPLFVNPPKLRAAPLFFAMDSNTWKKVERS